MDKRKVKDILISLILGYILYSVSLLSFFIAFPIMMLNRRYSYKEVGIAAFLLLLLITGTSVFQVRNAEMSKLLICNLLLGLFIPFSLLSSAIIWVKTRGEAVLKRYVKALLPACVSYIGFVVWFSLDATLLSQVTKSFSEVVSLMWGDFFAQLGIASDVFVDILLYAVQVVVLPLIAVIIGAVSFLQTASLRSADPEFNEQVATFSVSEKTIWPLLISWSLLVLSHFVTYPLALSLIVVNAVCITTLVYTFVGYCIAFHYYRKNRPYAKAINLFFICVALIMLLPGMNIALVFILSFLGIMETLFTIRK